jgi:hypothetical protein
MDALQELKIQAEILHKSIGDGVQRKDCLAMVAKELGFSSWPQAKAAISGEGTATEFGTLLYPKHATHFNLWYTRYEEAAAVRESRNGYLLGYKKQFLVVDRYFIESLGLDPDDRDWFEIGYDWIRPWDVAARTRLYGKLIAIRKKQ